MPTHIPAALALISRLQLGAVIARQEGDFLVITIAWDGCCNTQVFSRFYLAALPSLAAAVEHIFHAFASGSVVSGMMDGAIETPP